MELRLIQLLTKFNLNIIEICDRAIKFKNSQQNNVYVRGEGDSPKLLFLNFGQHFSN